ncbi:Hsp20 family protein [Kordiimonas sp. SCSIO 12610]|uniref:Hsp20 family protein n=1 Tax=Kordiimonas sp. SCSIO 12610 TaxID=2829597 RepID=UPI00210BF4FE|nr:Hsp20 family protein [Kordiimonas sp. SCSIO 12610]UTW55802.1 Hsp20 family protein [Kordiimonas sp. SCSIO 12610]
MRTFDLSPLLRSTVGFDHLNRLVDSALNADTPAAYPPYNIEKLGEDDYRITMAVAGFSEDEVTITVQEGTLYISAKAKDDGVERKFLHQGIAKRAFERRFELADTIHVGDASLVNGLLEIELKRIIPDHKKPRNIKITKAKASAKTIEQDASKLEIEAA